MYNESLLSRNEWNSISRIYRIGGTDPTDLSSVCKVSLVDLIKPLGFNGTHRLLEQYPSFMGNQYNLFYNKSTLYKLDGVIARPYSHTIYTHQGLELPLTYGSYDHYTTAKLLWHNGHNDNGPISHLGVSCYRRPVTKGFKINGKSLLISSHPDHNNYWHWTFDCIARAFLMKNEFSHIFSMLDNIIVSIDGGPSQFQDEYIRFLLSLNSRLQLVRLDKPMQCEELYIYNTDLPLIHSKQSLQIFINAIKASMNSNYFPAKPSSAIYMRRSKGARNGRCLINEEALCDNLIRIGFEVIDPASLSLKEQFNYIQHAQIVVGVHGSSFVNMLFMNPSSKVIELVGPSYKPVHDCILASQLGLIYREVTINALGSSFSSNYCCDVQKTVSAISAILQE